MSWVLWATQTALYVPYTNESGFWVAYLSWFHWRQTVRLIRIRMLRTPGKAGY